MDDRATGVTELGNAQTWQNALDVTRQFDHDVGFHINTDKTQVWSHDVSPDADVKLEHLGLTYGPNNLQSPVLPRDSAKIQDALARLAHCPGNMETRSRLATAFIQPLFDWASPLMFPGTSKDAQMLFQGITHARAAWWCQPRFWAQHIELHRVFGTSIRALCNAGRVLNYLGARLNNRCPQA